MGKYLKFIVAGVVIFLITTMFTGKTTHNSEAHKVALSFIENSPHLVEVVGNTTGITLSANGNLVEKAKAKLIFNVHGDVDSGKVHILLAKVSGKWEIVSASVETDHRKNLSLLK